MALQGGALRRLTHRSRGPSTRLTGAAQGCAGLGGRASALGVGGARAPPAGAAGRGAACAWAHSHAPGRPRGGCGEPSHRRRCLPQTRVANGRPRSAWRAGQRRAPGRTAYSQAARRGWRTDDGHRAPGRRYCTLPPQRQPGAVVGEAEGWKSPSGYQPHPPQWAQQRRSPRRGVRLSRTRKAAAQRAGRHGPPPRRRTLGGGHAPPRAPHGRAPEGGARPAPPARSKAPGRSAQG